jgi:hypothetical protein
MNNETRPCDHRREVIVQSCRIEAALRRALLAPLRHDAHGMRSMPQGDLQHLLRRRHLQVERNGQLLGEAGNIVVGNVPPILAQMRGDAVRARVLRDQCRTHGIGVGRAARIPDRRDMVDIDPEPQMAGRDQGHWGIRSGCPA